ncbi:MULTISPECIES: hypothetical protein [Gordonia]|uniref:hypothetical protein n=1 Tax=Gordonia TaxID=2053 RepID=UPI0008154B4D|nr:MULTISPECIES: hypothetical protein [Gordonia]MBR7194035.1 hypothetical protein [Gordonia sp. SCSIO 19800]MCT1352712.1 hypothetical protein [Gordonia sp. p3-SID1431]UPG67546.1 hypothetical protein MVF96_19295 [Gordonia hongkongensis]SCC54917.1 hypothetical protein GA0061091_12543 [Gordonia sp. v-85]
MTNESSSNAPPGDQAGQRVFAAQTATVVAILCSSFGIPFLFADNRVVIALVLATTTLLIGCALALPRRTRSWGGVVVAAAVPVYLITGVM